MAQACPSRWLASDYTSVASIPQFTTGQSPPQPPLSINSPVLVFASSRMPGLSYQQDLLSVSRSYSSHLRQRTHKPMGRVSGFNSWESAGAVQRSTRNCYRRYGVQLVPEIPAILLHIDRPIESDRRGRERAAFARRRGSKLKGMMSVALKPRAFGICSYTTLSFRSYR